jgi:hypothetical protein
MPRRRSPPPPSRVYLEWIIDGTGRVCTSGPESDREGTEKRQYLNFRSFLLIVRMVMAIGA